MQYKNYLPYATSMESPPPGLTTPFSFSLEEEKIRPKGKKEKKKNPKDQKPTQILTPQNILVPKSGTCRRRYSSCKLSGLLRETGSYKKSAQCAPSPTPSPLAPGRGEINLTHSSAG